MSGSISGASGSLNASMLKQMQEQMFRQSDSNGDGGITAGEMSQMSTDGSSTENMFSRLESDSSIARMARLMKGQGSPPPPEETDSGTSADGPTAAPGSKTSVKTLLETFSSALQSGNRADARKALAALQDKAASVNADSSKNPFLKDLQSLGGALESGEASDARSILAGIQDKMKSQGPPPEAAPDSSASGPSAIDTLFAALGSALQSGDTSEAQKALAALQKEASSSGDSRSDSPLLKDLAALGSTLDSGSLGDAWDIFSGIQDRLSSGAQSEQTGDSSDQSEGTDSRDYITDALKKLLDAIEKESTAATGASGNDLQNVIAAAIKSYVQQNSAGAVQAASDKTSQMSSELYV